MADHNNRLKKRLALSQKREALMIESMPLPAIDATVTGQSASLVPLAPFAEPRSLDAEADALVAEIQGKLDEEKIAALVDACQQECLRAVIGPLGVGRVLFINRDKDGGNVTTIHNMQNGIGPAEEKDKYNRDDYTGGRQNKNKNSFKKSAKKYKDDMKKKYGVLIDETTGRPAMSPEADHIVSCSEYHKSGGFMQSEDDKKEFASDKDNFQILDKMANTSKRDKNATDWVNDNRERFGMDKRRTNSRISRGIKTKNKHLPTTRQKLKFYIKGAARTGIQESGRMGFQQAISVLMDEFIKACFAEVRDVWRNGFIEKIDSNFMSSLKARLTRVAIQVHGRWGDAFHAFRDGVVSGFLSNLLTVAINIFCSTMKKWVRIIREGSMSLYRAVKILAFPPHGMSPVEAAHEASKVVATGIVTGIGILVEDILNKALPISSWGVLAQIAPYISAVVVGLITGLGTAFTAYMLDRLDLFGVNAKARHSHVIAKLNEVIDISYEKAIEQAKAFHGPILLHLT